MANERLRLGGVVHALHRTTTGEVADVLFEAPPTCPRCAEGRGCGAGLFARRGRVARISVTCGTTAALEVGQAVTVSVAGGSITRIAGLAYGLPLGCAVLATGAASLAGFGEGAAVLAAVCGLAIGAKLARGLLRSAERAGRLLLGIEN